MGPEQKYGRFVNLLTSSAGQAFGDASKDMLERAGWMADNWSQRPKSFGHDAVLLVDGEDRFEMRQDVWVIFDLGNDVIMRI